MSSILGAESRTLDLAAYSDEFERVYWEVTDFWKLEVGQSFAEPANDSWLAFSQNHWEESLDLLERKYKTLIADQGRLAKNGGIARRVRVVQYPITPYVQWEMHALRLRNRAGGVIRVLSEEQALKILGESAADLFDELYTLGERVLYSAKYDDLGVLSSVEAVYDKDVVASVRATIAGLFELAEPIDDFFEREIASLPKPRVAPIGVDSGYFHSQDRARPPRI